jgi:hypothetical protein
MSSYIFIYISVYVYIHEYRAKAILDLAMGHLQSI